jgi:hypothetical protein
MTMAFIAGEIKKDQSFSPGLIFILVAKNHTSAAKIAIKTIKSTIPERTVIISLFPTERNPARTAMNKKNNAKEIII